MASNQALFTAFSGLDAQSRFIEVTGNNIANVGTTSFKSSRVEFADLVYRNLSIGEAPVSPNGGSNPSQIGTGVRVSGTLRDFSAGAISATGVPGDLAIDGGGFFIVEHGTDQLYTRDGAFRIDANNQLVTLEGDRVLGAGVDGQFQIQDGSLGPLTIPVGELTIADATSLVRLSGNLNAGGDTATRGSRIRLGTDATSGFSLINNPTVPPADPDVLEATSLLSEIADPEDPAGDTPLFSGGQSIELRGARKGGSNIAPASFLVAATSTVQDLMDFLGGALSIQDSGANPVGGTPGVSLNPRSGELRITGNIGTASDLDVESTDLRLLDADGSLSRFPFVSERQAQADGESVRTTFIAFDSLGNPVDADATLVLGSKQDTGTTWRYFLESSDDTDLDKSLTSGVLEFDNFGLLQTTTPIAVRIDRAGTGAQNPMSFEISLLGGENGVTALNDVQSNLASTFRDGAAIGTLEDFTIDPDGTIQGAFSNTLIRPLGRIGLSSFRNPAGLVGIEGNLFRAGANSGTGVVLRPGEAGAGQIVNGSLELSNVDLGREFINLILASTGYSASSRVIQTSNDLFDRILSVAR